MRIYIDFDDVICETAKAFTVFAKELYGVDVPYEKVHFFNLQKSFNLDEEQYRELMRVGHIPEKMLAYEETKGATDTIKKWASEGHEVFIMTGRPFESYEPSRQWLNNHGLEGIPMYCVDKYGRDNFLCGSSYSLTLEEMYKMNFDFAVEDSPVAFNHLLNFDKCRVAVIDRPWNKQAEFPNANFVRCMDWQEIDSIFISLLFEA